MRLYVSQIYKPMKRKDGFASPGPAGAEGIDSSRNQKRDII